MLDYSDTEKQENIESAQRIDSLKARIKNHTGDTPLAIRSDNYTDLSTQEIGDVTNEIAANPQISAIEVAVTVSENGAEEIMRSFLNNEYATELRFNVFGNVIHPSQWRLMRTQADFEERVDSHNYVREQREQQSLLLLSGLSTRGNHKRQRLDEATLPPLPKEVLRDKLKPILTSKKKRLITE